MPDQTPTKRRQRPKSISDKREFAAEGVGTKLWAADHKVFREFVGRRGAKPAELLREIVHEWAVKKRLSGLESDTLEIAEPVRRFHRQIITNELAPLNATLNSILSLLKHPDHTHSSANANTPPDNQTSAIVELLNQLSQELRTTKEELRQLKSFAAMLQQLKAFASAHYLLSAQSFAVDWATFDFIQRYIAEPFLKDDPENHADPYETSTAQRDSARKEGLKMVEQMCLGFQYPAEFEIILFSPGNPT